MRRLTFRERQRRMREAAEAAVRWGQLDAEDVGLRSRYRELPRAPIRLIVSPMGKAVNQGGILRIAEAFRLERVDFQAEPDGLTDLSGGSGVWEWQPYRWRDVTAAIDDARAEGYAVYGLTLSEDAVDVGAFAPRFPCALVLGEEKLGLDPAVAARCDARVAIPQFGLVASINVGAATAIAVDHLMRAYRRADPTFVPARAAGRRLVEPD